MLQRYLYGGVMALIFLLFLTAANYHRLLSNARAERDLYSGQVIALQDSLRILAQTDTSSVGAQTAMPGEDGIDEALTTIDLPEGIRPGGVNSVTEFVYTPPADTLEGTSIGNPVDGGREHLFDVGLKTQQFTGRIFVRNDSLTYAFQFDPIPHRIQILNRRVGVVNERIIFAPGLITEINAFDRALPQSKTPKRSLRWRIRGFATIIPAATTLYGVEAGPVWSLGPFDVGAGLGLYGDGVTPGQLIGGWAAATLTL